MVKRVYDFSEADGTMKKLLGGKGTNLAEMTKLGFPVPPGFTISTEACGLFLKGDRKIPDDLWKEVKEHVESLEKSVGKKFGDKGNPLLVSVRSGAAVSMPGMMDTILNLGLNGDAATGLAELSGNPRFAWDSYRRFIQMFGNITKGIKLSFFEEKLEQKKEEVGAKEDVDLKAEDLKALIPVYLAIYKEKTGEDFPVEPLDQLRGAIEAVFNSWDNERAVAYREHEDIPHDIYTAVNVQAMVFGNMGDDSGTGVAFTRNPASGEKQPFGEYLINAQGEDVVAGIRTPEPIARLHEQMPKIYDELVEISNKLEEHFKEMQDLEFTVEKGRLYMLQTRTGKRTGIAASKIAYDLVQEGLIDKKTAVKRITARDVENCLFPTCVWINQKNGIHYDITNIDEELKNHTLEEVLKKYSSQTKHADKLGEGLPAGPGAAVGHVVFDSDKAKAIVAGKEKPSFEITMKTKDGKTKLILVKEETSPEDFHGMVASEGILTMTGGMTSHAALVARQIGKRCIVGSKSSGLSLKENSLVSKDGKTIKEGDIITLDVFEKGLVYSGYIPIFKPTKLPEEMEHILDWADELAKIKVRTNADKKNDTQAAIDFKATGTGLARTEHQFFDVLETVRKMILSASVEERQKYIDEMEKYQEKDFIDLFQAADGRPVTIRLIDPPLHEFLPHEIELREKIWKENLGKDSKEYELLEQVLNYKEANPMLGLRGCRLGIMFPELMEMQAKAILGAAEIVRKEGKKVQPEIMIPLVGFKNEFLTARKAIIETAEKMGIARDTYKVGTMIEIPRAALVADEIAGGEDGAEFFSFGTNDLHQMTLGFSRDDVAKFLPMYLEKGIIPADPFQTIDQEGTGILMKMCVEKGRKAAAEAGRYLKVGICGEQGGEPKSINFCYNLGLDYVSCSPFRVPVARLSAAHASLNNPEPDAKYGKKL